MKTNKSHFITKTNSKQRSKLYLKNFNKIYYYYFFTYCQLSVLIRIMHANLVLNFYCIKGKLLYLKCLLVKTITRDYYLISLKGEI